MFSLTLHRSRQLIAALIRRGGVAVVVHATALAAPASFVFLGDTHFDREEYHDAAFLAKPGHRNHARYTEASWARLIDLVHGLTQEHPVRAIIQTGDLHEGLAATPEKQRAQQRDVLAALATERFEVPWLLVKGNHDITGPEAKAAYAELVHPFMSRELGRDIARGYYAWRSGNAEFFAADCYDPEGLLPFLERELPRSTAAHKFVALHEPVIGATASGAHVFDRQPRWAAFGAGPAAEKRARLLEVIARHRAIVLCGHVHSYSLLRRETPAGPIVQVMMGSVFIRPDRSTTTLVRDYGVGPEAEHVTYFKKASLPGIGLITIDAANGDVKWKLFANLTGMVFDEENLSELQRGRPATAIPQRQGAL